jgi:hypothetical protein
MTNFQMINRKTPEIIKKDAILMAASPLQLLCAIEAILYFRLENYFLIVNASKSAYNEKQMVALLREFKLSNYFLMTKTGRGSFWKFVQIYYRLRRTYFSYGFIGENGPAFRSLCFSLKPAKIYVLDDGVASFEAQRDICTPSRSYLWRTRFGKLRAYRYALVGMTLKQPRNIDFFSAILKRPITGERVITHKFENVIAYCAENLQGIQQASIKNKVVFVDTPLTTTQLLSEGDCRRVYKFALERYRSDGTLVFRPHRSQPEEELRQLVDSAGIEFVPNHRPVELDFILGGLPAMVVGTISTALLTLKALFPNLPLVSLDIRPGVVKNARLRSDRKTLILLLYEEYDKRGIELVSLPIWDEHDDNKSKSLNE